MKDMRSKLLGFLTFFFLLSSMYVSYKVFISMRAQYLILTNAYFNQLQTFSETEIESMFGSIPNISATAVPLDAFKALYYLKNMHYDKAQQLLESANKANPHMYFSELLLGELYFAKGNLDSAFYYGKKAFYGWPKANTHFDFYNKVLLQKNDSLEIVKAYDFIDSIFSDRHEYSTAFIKTMAQYKLNNLKENYVDLSPIVPEILIGKWVRVFEYKNNYYDSIPGSSIRFKKQNKLITNNNVEYTYKLVKDSLYMIVNQKTLSKSIVLYSKSSKTLILDSDPKTNIPRQYYKKHK